MTVEVTGDGQAEIRPVTHKGMIVNHVHDHTDTIPDASPHHLLELTDTSLGIVRIGGICSLRGRYSSGFIPPIVHIILQASLVHRAINIGRKDMDQGNAQLLQMIHAGSHAARPLSCPPPPRRETYLYASRRSSRRSRNPDDASRR